MYYRGIQEPVKAMCFVFDVEFEGANLVTNCVISGIHLIVNRKVLATAFRIKRRFQFASDNQESTVLEKCSV